MKNFIAIGLGVVAVVIAALPLFSSGGNLGNATQSFWQATYFVATNTTAKSTLAGGIKVGSSGTSISRVNAGFCTIHSTATSIGALASSTVSCQGATTGGLSALTGVAVGDVCSLGIATSTNTGGIALRVVAASASSTQGYIHAVIGNTTTASFTWSAAASSSWPYSCIQPN